VRTRIDGISFNEQIEREYRGGSEQEEIETLVRKVSEERDAILARLGTSIENLRRQLHQLEGYEAYKTSADLLAGAAHLVHSASRWVDVPDWSSADGSLIRIELDPSLTAGQNVEAYYTRYRKAKRTCQNLQEELQRTQTELSAAQEHYGHLLATDDEGRYNRKLLRIATGTTGKATPKDPYAKAPGLRFASGAFTLLVGRNAKENDELLRRWVRGNDHWMHTRDCPGGFVFIKALAGKTIPLETLLDAATLALVYSKAKDRGKADLYWTQVKHLRRQKEGKTGTVLPSHEKNFAIELDDARLKRLFLDSGNQPDSQ
jgi:predicted ribosome quality control (RQC) complex YloA/Tae2 family protein